MLDDGGESSSVLLGTIERTDSRDDVVGMTLAEGREMLRGAQEFLIRAQCQAVSATLTHCVQCGKGLTVKGQHRRQIRTVFGCVEVASPRLRHCACHGHRPGASFSPLVMAFPTQMTPELEYLQVKWAAHLPYAAATNLLKEVLPIADSVSVTGLRRRVRAVGSELDRAAEEVVTENKVCANADVQDVPVPIHAVAVDSAWLKHCDPPRPQGRHVNLIAGRAMLGSGKTRLYAYVNNQVPSAAIRLDQFLAANGVREDERVTILSDGAGEFQKAVEGSVRPLCRILDWFHIAMKFRAAEQSVLKHPELLAPNGRLVEDEIKSAKWLTWHGKVGKAVARIKEIHDALELRLDSQLSPLWWNLREIFWYLESNERYMVNYSRRHRKGLPISSAMAESAVNQVVSIRFAKKQQMRWSDEGAHLLAQVRVHALNGDLRPRAVTIPLRLPKPVANPWLDALLLKQAA